MFLCAIYLSFSLGGGGGYLSLWSYNPAPSEGLLFCSLLFSGREVPGGDSAYNSYEFSSLESQENMSVIRQSGGGGLEGRRRGAPSYSM